MELARLIIGGFINVEIWIMLMLNVLVLACIIKGRLYAKKDNSAYILAGFNITCDICQLTLHLLYIGPAIVAGSWLFDGQDSPEVTIISTIFLGLWYLGSLMQMLFATNRFVVICFPRKVFFSKKRVVVFILISFCTALGMVIYSQLLSPCCRITPDPLFYSYSYLNVPDATFNPSMYFVDLPLDSGTSLYCGASYIALFIYVHKVGIASNSAWKRELRCCIQFMLMFLAYTIAWVTFFVYPVLQLQQREAYSITLILVVTNSGINSVIYLSLNSEIRHAANQLLQRAMFKDPHIAARSTWTVQLQSRRRTS
ncbi:hypothetical protein Aduo_000832 [Ancylostoma duodenale]